MVRFACVVLYIWTFEALVGTDAGVTMWLLVKIEGEVSESFLLSNECVVSGSEME